MYFKPNTFFNEQQILSYANQMLSNNSISNISIVIISDKNAGFLGTHTIENNKNIITLNFAAIQRNAMYQNVDAHLLTLCVIAHELGHYIHFNFYNGFDFVERMYASDCPIVKQRNVMFLEVNAGKHARQFVTEDFAELFESDNDSNVELHKNRLKSLVATSQISA